MDFKSWNLEGMIAAEFAQLLLTNSIPPSLLHLRDLVVTASRECKANYKLTIAIHKQWLVSVILGGRLMVKQMIPMPILTLTTRKESQ